MDNKGKKSQDINALKKHRREFLQRTEEDDLSLQRRIQEMCNRSEQITVGNVQLKWLMEESIQELRFQKQNIANQRDEYLRELDRKIKTMEKEKEDALWEEKKKAVAR